jgi:heterodisulfide reductase subunit B
MNEAGIVDEEYRLAALCTMCFNVLKRSNLRILENEEALGTINNFMYLENGYHGRTKVVHFLELLRDIGFAKVSEKVQLPLQGLKVAPYYGCLLLRPKKIGIDNPAAPRILSDLLEALGAEPIHNPLQTRCCGSYQTVRDPYAVAELTHEILGRARKEGADLVITSCPLCMFNLADRQKEVMERHPEFEPMPVLYFTQLMALSYGLEGVCGFDQDCVDARSLLREKALFK